MKFHHWFDRVDTLCQMWWLDSFDSDSMEERGEKKEEEEERVDEEGLGSPHCGGCTVADTVTVRLRRLQRLLKRITPLSVEGCGLPRELTDVQAMVRQLEKAERSAKKRRRETWQMTAVG